ncbi:hypothetical protein ACTXT7_015463 [Hymenolepis weldensis]
MADIDRNPITSDLDIRLPPFCSHVKCFALIRIVAMLTGLALSVMLSILDPLNFTRFFPFDSLKMTPHTSLRLPLYISKTPLDVRTSGSQLSTSLSLYLHLFQYIIAAVPSNKHLYSLVTPKKWVTTP